MPYVIIYKTTCEYDSDYHGEPYDAYVKRVSSSLDGVLYVQRLNDGRDATDFHTFHLGASFKTKPEAVEALEAYR